MIVGRIDSDGNLSAQGINTRMPAITDGLVSYMPCDGTLNAINTAPILSTDSWTESGGSAPGFSLNGPAASNKRHWATGPFGERALVWEGKQTMPASGGDSGWNSTQQKVDNTKLHRVSVWMRRTVVGDGSSYLGIRSGDGSVLNRSNRVANSNPYIWSGAWNFPVNEWVLIVGHVWPWGTPVGASHPDSGIYNTMGDKLVSTSDFIFDQHIYNLVHRTYLYYSSDASTRQEFVYPKIEECDGNHATIQELISSPDTIFRPYMGNSQYIINDDCISLVSTDSNVGDKNLVVQGLSIYNNLRVPASITLLDEQYNNQPIYRLTMTVTDASSLNSFRTALHSHGVRTNTAPFTGGRVYMAGITWRSADIENVRIGGAGNTVVWNQVGTTDTDDGWQTSMIRTNPIAATTTDAVYFAFASADILLNKEFSIDFTCPMLFDYNTAPSQPYLIPQYRPNGFPTPSPTGFIQLPIPKATDPSITVFAKIRTKARTNGTLFQLVTGGGSDVTKVTYNVSSNAEKGFLIRMRHESYGSGTTTNALPGLDESYMMPGVWHNVALVIQNEGTTATRNIIIYANGVRISTMQKAAGGAGQLYVGGEYNNSNSSNPCDVKDIAIYKRTLSEDEIRSISSGMSIVSNVKDPHIAVNGISTEKNVFGGPSSLFEGVHYYPLSSHTSNEFNTKHASTDTTVPNGATYVGGNRLEYDFISNYGINWAGDWNICYFKKPVATHSGQTNKTGYNIESFGSSTGTVVPAGKNLKYMWWGKADGSNTIPGAVDENNNSTAAFNPSDYFDKHQFINIRCIGGQVTVDTYLSDGVTRRRKLGNIASNDTFKSSLGYDFKLGGWNGNAGCHAWFYNMYVSPKRALTDEEVAAIYKTKMSVDKRGLNIRKTLDTTSTIGV